MATFIQVEEPKETYNEIKALIELHYKTLKRSGFNFATDGFDANFPNIYRLFLQIAAHGQEFGIEVGR